MTDEVLIARLRKQSNSGRANHVSKSDRLAAADRIEELGKACTEWAEVSQSNYQRAKASQAKLAKAVKVLNALDATLDRNGWHFASIAREDIRATIAEIKGETK